MTLPVGYQLERRTRDDADFYCLMGRFFGSRMIARALGMPMYDDPGRVWCIVLGPDGAPVACSSIEMKQRSAVFKSAWVEPAARGQGIYNHMFAERLAIAQERGVTVITATTTAQSCRTHERYGFGRVGQRGKYALYKKELD